MELLHLAEVMPLGVYGLSVWNLIYIQLGLASK